MQHERTSFVDKVFKDSHGTVVVMQKPNAPLILWIVLRVAAFLTKGSTAHALAIASSVVLAIWAALELFKGVNYFRRGLGLVVLALSVMTLIQSK